VFARLAAAFPVDAAVFGSNSREFKIFVRDSNSRG